jgi:transcription initiation factor TFIIIB Brf1 subunit/transcription initiation factor TFIIB
MVDQGQEWRQFDDDTGPSKSRVGGAIDPLLPVHEQLGTRVATGPRTGDVGRDSRAACFATSCARADRTSHLQRGLRSLRSLCVELSLPASVQQLACEVYHAVATADVKMPRRNNVHSLFVACLHVAARGAGFPRTVAELARPVHYAGSSAFQSGAGLTDKQFKHGLGRIKAVAQGASDHWLQELLRTPASQLPEQAALVDRQLAALSVPYAVRRAAATMLEQHGGFVSGHRPQLVAAAVTWLAVRAYCRQCPASRGVTDSQALEEVGRLSGFGGNSIQACETKLTTGGMDLTLATDKQPSRGPQQRQHRSGPKTDMARRHVAGSRAATAAAAAAAVKRQQRAGRAQAVCAARSSGISTASSGHGAVDASPTAPMQGSVAQTAVPQPQQPSPEIAIRTWLSSSDYVARDGVLPTTTTHAAASPEQPMMDSSVENNEDVVGLPLDLDCDALLGEDGITAAAAPDVDEIVGGDSGLCGGGGGLTQMLSAFPAQPAQQRGASGHATRRVRASREEVLDRLFRLFAVAGSGGGWKLSELLSRTAQPKAWLLEVLQEVATYHRGTRRWQLRTAIA